MSEPEPSPSPTPSPTGGFLSDLERDVTSLLGKAGADATRWLAAAEQELQSATGGSIQEWSRMLLAEYGCWCGPGHRCEEDVDAMDSCCHSHDLAYDALKLDFVNSWTPAGIVAAKTADQALIDCVSAKQSDDDDQATKDYRAMLLDVYRTRVALADRLSGLGS